MHLRPDRGFDHAVPSEITPRAVYEGRRDWLQRLAAGALGTGLAGWAGREALAQAAPAKGAALPGGKSAVVGANVMDAVTPRALSTTYNNFYEFGTDKADPAR
ncbi:MAG TPA: protein-methionine-sulfoxide reductase catalytic subunit MsrP, partial [Aquabacterium sp.]|nr:protein-methionine-sulfoxide reductase catalytic subunit MsrP [Aquabacterium sp.]